MKKCPLNSFNECDKECVWYFNGIIENQCAILNLLSVSYLSKLSELETDISQIKDVLISRLPK